MKFDASKTDTSLIRKIAAREVAKRGGRVLDVAMDIEAVHSNGCPLRLDDLLNADDWNFTHDVLGIVQNLDRNTGKLLNHFHPRFAARITD